MAELQYTSLIGDANLKAYYRMSAGGLTTDSSTGGNTLTNNNSVAENTGGQFSGAADFGSSNTNKSLSVASRFGMLYTASRTYSFWIKMNTEISSGTQCLMFQSHDDSRCQYFIEYEYNGGSRRLIFNRYKPNIGENLFTNSISLGTSSWHHIVMTYNGTTLAGYVDNVATSTVAASGAGTLTESALLTVCSREGTEFASCLIDDFCVFDRVLTAGEVNTLYTDLSASTNYLTNYRLRKRIPGTISV